MKRKGMIIGIIVSTIFVFVGVLFLSLSVETLDEVADELGASESSVLDPLLPDYGIPGLEENSAVNIIVGVGFTLFTLVVTFALGKALKARRK